MLGFDVGEQIEHGLKKVFQAYGVGSTNLILVSGVFISTLGVSERIDAGVWIVSVFATFSLIYMFRAHVPHNLLRTAKIALGTAAVILFPAAILLLTQGGAELLRVYDLNTKLSTAYVAFLIGSPAALLLLSYHQHDQDRAPISKTLASVVKRNVLNNDFYYKSVLYTIRFDIRDSAVWLWFHIHVHGVNRSRNETRYVGVFEPAGEDVVFHAATLNGKDLDTEDPDHRTGRGYNLVFNCMPGEEFKIDVTAESRFHGRDSEHVGAYRPTEYCRVEIESPPKGLSVNAQSLLGEKARHSTTAAGSLVYEMADGLLPHQGIRLFWNVHEGSAGES